MYLIAVQLQPQYLLVMIIYPPYTYLCLDYPLPPPLAPTGLDLNHVSALATTR